VNRTVITRRDIIAEQLQVRAFVDPPVGLVAEDPPDGYLGRLVKYIPPDVIGAFLALEGAIGAAGKAVDTTVLGWVVFAIILIGTPFYLRKVGGVTKPLQIAISTGAFIVWAFAYSGPPFAALGIPTIYGTVAIGLYTFLIPLIEV